MNIENSPSTLSKDEAYQYQILTGVSRTFALTIPQLPGSLRRVVANAYLLCRIADTIEDDPGIQTEDKARFHEHFVDVIRDKADPHKFSETLALRLTKESLPEERELIRNTPRVIRITQALRETTQIILSDRVEIMCRGMPLFQRNPRSDGLANLAAMDQYCYYVAGVVGQMLTELFCDYSQRIMAVKNDLFRLAPSFGQGLQMTNILKDVWDDIKRGACWLPKDIFEQHGYDLAKLSPDYNRTEFTAGVKDLIGVAHGHLRNALTYSLLIPRQESGIRRFCLWSLSLAILTLQKIYSNPNYRSGQEVKVSRKTVYATTLSTAAICRSNLLIRLLFSSMSKGLPLQNEVSVYRNFDKPLSAQQ